jgi:tRNA/rRNA methyltransferase
MGGGRLSLIAPLSDFQSDEAKQGAAGAQDTLKATEVYQSLEEFYSRDGQGLRIAFSARINKTRTAQTLNQTLAQLAKRSPSDFFERQSIHLFFGPEDDGLTTQDMNLMNHICSLPTYGAFTSLNLSHAVSLALYIFQDFLARLSPAGDLISKPITITTSTQNPREPVYYPQKTIEQWLEVLGFDLSAQKVNIAKTLHKLLLENNPGSDDLRLLETVLQQNIRKLTKPTKSTSEDVT